MTTDAVPGLDWLPPAGDFDAALAGLKQADLPAEEAWRRLAVLANRRLDFMQTRRLDRALSAVARLQDGTPSVRLALVGNATLDHLASGVRVGALRRGLRVEIHVGPFGQWRQDILDPASTLRAFNPDAVLLALEPAAIMPEVPIAASAGEVAEVVDGAVHDLVRLWRTLRDDLRTAVVQQLPWMQEPSLFGHFERLVPASPAALSARFERALVEAAAEEGVVVLDLRGASTWMGVRQVHDPMLWHHGKQAISPAGAPWAGDQIARVAAALRGLSKKVLVLDLDNTLWGGTIGDDGVDGIVIGQGSGAGEAYLAFQHYLKRLAARGVVLAVSSKNDLMNVTAAFDEHPEMVLRSGDFAALEVNWNDKPSAVRRIAEGLNLGLDALVFFDDNPAERDLMRRSLPMVAVPEVPEAPELFPRCLAEAGYFEAVSFTAEDGRRNAQYAANRVRRESASATTDVEGFLRDLAMTLTVTGFRRADVPRITQLINKTNQFNLTTRRYAESEVRALMEDPAALTFSARLSDRFGDNGLTSVVIGRLVRDGEATLVDLDTWLMSCRIFGRRVEDAILTVVANAALTAGADKLVGRYRPTAKNGLVKNLYPGFGFAPLASADDGEAAWVFSLHGAKLPETDHLTLVCER